MYITTNTTTLAALREVERRIGAMYDDADCDVIPEARARLRSLREDIARALADLLGTPPRRPLDPVGDGSVIRACAELVRKACADEPLTEAECEEMRTAAMDAKRDHDTIVAEVRALRGGTLVEPDGRDRSSWARARCAADDV